MLSRIRHRGPDDEGVYHSGSVGLGHVRLSIIDLSSAGHQPFLSADGSHVLVYNGEIYNYRELRKELEAHHTFRSQTDTEVLLASLMHWGMGALQRLNGMFAFAWYQRDVDQLTLVRDRFGIKPLYFSREANEIVFGSEIRSVQAGRRKQASVNEGAVLDYLVFDRTDHVQDTFFEGISHVEPGGYVTCSSGKVESGTWYALEDEVDQGFESALEFRELLSDAVRLRMRSDVPLGVCLSGGLDSSTLVSLMLDDHDVSGLSTFSAAYPKGVVGDEGKFRAPYKSRCNMYETWPDADSFLRDLEDFTKAVEEPVPDTSPYAQYKVMELARKHVTVLLDGQGADEQLAGYHYFFGFHLRQLLASGRLFGLIQESMAYALNHRSFYGLGAAAFSMLPASVQHRWKRQRATILSPEFALREGRTDVITRALYNADSIHNASLAHFRHKLGHLLKWEDRNSMWFSLESRVPFLDHRLVERSIGSAARFHIKNGQTKVILREAMQDILPSIITERRDKMGFTTPGGVWMNQDAIRGRIRDAVTHGKVAERRWYDPAQVEDLLSKTDLSTLDVRNLWKVLNLELWLTRHDS